MDETLFLDLCRLAESDNRSFSNYCERVLRLHTYGHAKRSADGNDRDG